MRKINLTLTFKTDLTDEELMAEAYRLRAPWDPEDPVTDLSDAMHELVVYSEAMLDHGCELVSIDAREIE